MEHSVAEAAEVYVRVGRPDFLTISLPNSPLRTVSPEDFESGHFNFCGFGSTKIRMALALARLRHSEGRLLDAKAFAAYGIATVGSASVLKSQFEVVLTST